MATTDRMQQLVGERIRRAREAKKWTQEKLAETMGIADRQTVSTIESGERKVAADEMVRFIAVLERSLAFFTDPHLMVEENAFSYRARRTQADVAIFERQAIKLIETNRRLRALLGGTPPLTFSGVRGLLKTSPLETAEFFGYRFSVNWGLDKAECPAKQLRKAITDLGILILEVDAPESISGAACHLEDGDVILLNRREPSYRKNFTLGHELFHLLTWQDMPPAKIDVELDRKPKVEQLADAFTGNLLLPSTVLKRVWDRSKGDMRERVLDVARYFDVSGDVAYFRLIRCRYLRDPDQSLKDKLARGNESVPPGPPFEKGFVERLHRVIADGRMTANAAADALEYSRKDLVSLFAEHGMDDPINA